MLQRLAALRKSRNWSMQETADRLGIAKSTYAGYESGYREPSLQALCQIADLFETTVDDVLNRPSHTTVLLELTEQLKPEKQQLSIDTILLTEEELIDFIAFTRYKRSLLNKK